MSFISRSLFSTTKQALTSASSLRLLRPLPLLRPLSSVAAHFRRLTPPHSATIRGLTTRSSRKGSEEDSKVLCSRPTANWSIGGPDGDEIEDDIDDGCDFEHWLVVVAAPKGKLSRDEIIDTYIKVLSQVVGSDEEARMKIYSVSTRHYFGFGALISEELSYKLKEIPCVEWVIPDSYVDWRNKSYGAEPFVDGKALPYHPKYHKAWVRNFIISENNKKANQYSSNMGPNMAGVTQENIGQNMAGGPLENMGHNIAPTNGNQ